MIMLSSLLFATIASAAAADTTLTPGDVDCTKPPPAGIEAPWNPSPRREDYPWMSRQEWCQRFQANLHDPARAGAQLVFMGDSITQGWTEKAPAVWSSAFGAFHPLRLGIGGDRTQNLIWRIDQGELAGLQPKLLVLLIGINNLSAGDAAVDTAHGVRVLLERIRAALPTTQVLMLGILPSGASAKDPLRARIQECNEELQRLAGSQVVYADIGAVFLTSDGSIDARLMPDALHPGEAGYQIFAGALGPWLQKLF